MCYYPLPFIISCNLLRYVIFTVIFKFPYLTNTQSFTSYSPKRKKQSFTSLTNIRFIFLFMSQNILVPAVLTLIVQVIDAASMEFGSVFQMVVPVWKQVIKSKKYIYVFCLGDLYVYYCKIYLHTSHIIIILSYNSNISFLSR